MMDKKDINNEFKKPWFWAYLISLVLLVVTFNLFKGSKTINVASLFILSFIQFIYGYHQYKADYNKTKWDKYNAIGYAICLFVLAIMNLALKVNEPMVAVSILLFSSGIIMFGFTIILFKKLWNSNSERIEGTIFFYVFFTLSLNYSFAFLYSVAPIFVSSSIIDHNGNNITGVWNYLYFSYSIFYNSFQGYILEGFSKILSLLQIVSSYIIHIIVLSCIIQKKLLCWKKKK